MIDSVAPARKSKSRSRMKLATGVRCVSMTARVRAAEMICRPSLDAATTMSEASSRSAQPEGMRGARRSPAAREPQMADDRAAFLCEAGDVEGEGGDAVDMRRHADEMRDGEDAGAADPGHGDVVGTSLRQVECRRAGQRKVRQRRAGPLAHRAARNRDKGRAKALEAG